MRIILSRKGFDSANGGVASPIFQDGTMLSLPIPSRSAPHPYSRMIIGGRELGTLVSHLTNGRVPPTHGAHLDPDLYPEAMARPPGWRPAFGQVASAQAHLDAQGVGAGDLFLFFGWFRELQEAGRGARVRSGSADLHVLFGWLQVAEVVRVGERPGDVVRMHSWLSDHPHVHFSAPNNTIYVATRALELPGLRDRSLPGAGVFRRASGRLVLTRRDQPLRSVWQVPGWMAPRVGLKTLSYHQDPTRWNVKPGHVELRTVGRGQEFVLDCDGRPEAVAWAGSLIEELGSPDPERA